MIRTARRATSVSVYGTKHEIHIAHTLCVVTSSSLMLLTRVELLTSSKDNRRWWVPYTICSTLRGGLTTPTTTDHASVRFSYYEARQVGIEREPP